MLNVITKFLYSYNGSKLVNPFEDNDIEFLYDNNNLVINQKYSLLFFLILFSILYFLNEIILPT